MNYRVALGCIALCGLASAACDRETSPDNETSEAAATAPAAAASEEAAPPLEAIDGTAPPWEWLNKRLVSAEDLPEGCAGTWRQLVDAPKYLTFACMDFGGKRMDVVALEGRTLAAVSEDGDGAWVNALPECERLNPEDGAEAVHQLDCGDFYAVHSVKGPGGIASLMTFESQDVPGDIARNSQEAIVVGKRFELGDYAYTIGQPKKTDELGPSISTTKAGKGAIFIVVNYEIENLSNETKRALSGDFKLRDYRDRVFDASSDANTALAMAGEADLIVSELQPGLAKEAAVAFQVPVDVVEHPLTLLVPEKGFGNDQVEVPFILYTR